MTEQPRLSQTSVTVGVNRAYENGSTARQALATNASSVCRPLVRNQVTAGVKLASGTRSNAEPSIEARANKGTLATTNVARGVNIAAGRSRTARQPIPGQTGRWFSRRPADPPVLERHRPPGESPRAV